MIITLSGLAGSGKTTVAKILANKLNYKYLSAGELFRNIAKERNTSLEQLLELAEKNPGIDRELDKMVMKLASEGSTVVEGRLVGWHAKQYGMSSIRVWLEASFETRARRVAKRDGKSFEIVTEEIQKRENSDWQRFWDLYTIDINDLSVYSIIIDTTYLTPEQTANAIIQKLRDDRIAI
ncbi:MAG: AAA family ATPase [Candidatus Thermoplasmatota archaeon]|nr:AAA family ATPase [Candidatus Thermoplasmatota archaeon]